MQANNQDEKTSLISTELDKNALELHKALSELV